MTFHNIANNAESNLASPVGLSDLEITVVADNFPSAPFYITLGNSSINEIVEVTSKNGNVFTVGRARDGTTAKEFIIGDKVQLFMVAGLLTELQTASDNKVDKVTNKQLSTEDYTSDEKTKLSGIAIGANAYVHPSTDGSHHVPATNTTNNTKVLKSGATDGSEAWGQVVFSELGSVPTTLVGYGITDATPISILAGNIFVPYNVLQQAIINGNFSINQRVVSGTVILSAGAYGHDRWKAGASGCTYTFTTSANITTLTISAGSLQQIIEGLNLYTGTYTLSWTGTSQGKIGAGSYGATGITGSVTGGTNLTVEFGTGTLSKVNFNFGNTALPFQAKSFTDEHLACLRYYEKTYDANTSPGTNTVFGLICLSGMADSAGFADIINAFSVKKRVTPTVKCYKLDGTPNVLVISINGAVSVDIAASITPFTNISQTGFRKPGGLTPGQSLIFQGHYVADAEI